MPHIHTEPGEHDITVSMYIVRVQDDEPLALVHMHRKYHRLMQAGGHIERNESPWSAVAHELIEETGYQLDELSILQPAGTRIELNDVIVHPTPIVMNTHKINADHFHSDITFAFVAQNPPKALPADGESEDIRWLTLDELQTAVDAGEAPRNLYTVYETIIRSYLESYDWIHADEFLTDDSQLADTLTKEGTHGTH
jgi:8-oxo-dGTP pyrophosphatase MutT (NUDIX family)